MQRDFSQAVPSNQTQNIQAVHTQAQSYCAIVHEPTAYHYDADAYSCTARRLGIYPSHAAVSACLSFIAAIAGDDFKAWASYQVVPAV